MNFESLDDAWGSPANRPNPGEIERLAVTLVGQLRSRTRRLAAALVVAGGVLLTLSSLLAARLLTAPAGAGGDWALAPLLAPAWLAFLLVLRRTLRHRAEHPNPELSIAALVRAAEGEVRLARARIRLVSGLHVASLPALALGVWYLAETERVRPHELGSLAAVLGLLVVGALTGLQLYDRLHLRPRQQQLSALVASYA